MYIYIYTHMSLSLYYLYIYIYVYMSKPISETGRRLLLINHLLLVKLIPLHK